MDTDAARQMALVGVEFCFNHGCNAKSLQRIDWMGGYDGRTAMVTAMPSIVAESRGGRKSEFMEGGVVVFVAVAVAVGCFAIEVTHGGQQ
eukprot:CAMPEP_0202004630 /NCGR_PEP_ID=MMETSP0905-20130828/9890_1 /ASSEMBLY_ACC=CAM_ASM_000554 /TAXON_ID=420261 /ORGANISM="Thalassiosira antarctica, Strain CCMP982" /LENGTH=89 /DNA_ID=CAMNT_0048562013 /DNA_START=85 /DNA_END=354 /DNA_ORIENTATION=-